MAWALIFALASGVALYGVLVLLDPTVGPPFVAERRAATPWALYAHIGGGVWAIATGPWQLNQRIRQRYLTRHRWLGRSYALAVAIGGVGGLALAPHAQTGTTAALGFAALGVLWLATTAIAVVRIALGDSPGHGRWMVRSYALTLAALALRVYLPLSIASGVPFSSAYPAIAWLCWIPNLVAAELFLRRHSWRAGQSA